MPENRSDPIAAISGTDPLFLLPARYEDRTRVTAIGALLPGSRAVVEGEVQLADVVFRRRRALLVRISDGSGFLTLRFFYFSRAQQLGFTRGVRLRVIGEVRRGPQGLEMVHPEYRAISADAPPLDDRLTPIYPLTEGQTQGRVRISVDKALARLAANPAEDLLPAAIVAQLHLPPLREALQFMHHPPVGTSLESLAAGATPRSAGSPSRNCWRTSCRWRSSSSARSRRQPRRCATATAPARASCRRCPMRSPAHSSACSPNWTMTCNATYP